MMGPEPIIFIQAVLTINFKCLPFYIFIKIVPVFQVSRRREKVEESGIKKIKQNFGVQPLVGLEYLQGSINILFATPSSYYSMKTILFIIPHSYSQLLDRVWDKPTLSKPMLQLIITSRSGISGSNLLFQLLLQVLYILLTYKNMMYDEKYFFSHRSITYMFQEYSQQNI